MASCIKASNTSLLVRCSLPNDSPPADIVAVELRRAPFARPFAFATTLATLATALPLSGLRPNTTYWLACRAHNASHTEVSGWAKATSPFACTTKGAQADRSDTIPAAETALPAAWRAAWMYRVSENGRPDPDLLQNHNTGDLVGEAGFLSDSIDFQPFRRTGERGFFTAPAFPRDDPCMSSLNASCVGLEGFLQGDACMACAKRVIGDPASTAYIHCTLNTSQGRWWGDVVPRTFCGAVKDALFDFQRTPITRYCVRYRQSASWLAAQEQYRRPDQAQNLGLPDQNDGFARYLSCNAPEADRYGNSHERPLCICACFADRVIAKAPVNSIKAECGGGAPYFTPDYPQCNCTSTSLSALPDRSEPALRFVGRQPVLEPYYRPYTPPEAGWPPTAPPRGSWYSLPIGGACNGTLARTAGTTAKASMQHDNKTAAEARCTWDRPHLELHRIVYGMELLEHGWQVNSSYDEASGDRIDLTDIVAANAKALDRAMAALNDVLAPQSCAPSVPSGTIGHALHTWTE